MTPRVSADLVHEQIDEYDIWDDNTKQAHLFFEYFFLFAAFYGVEPFSVYKVEPIDMLEPDSSSAAFSDEGSVEYWEVGVEDAVE